MDKDDIQIGMVYTHIDYRNQRIATQMVNIISNTHNGDIWYIVDTENIYSINGEKSARNTVMKNT